MTNPIDPRAVLAYTQSRLPETLDFLRSLVAVNSFTANREGVLANAALIRDAFEPMGFAAEAVRSAEPRYGDHLFLERPGLAGGPTVVLVSHLDTVFPPEEEEANDFRWRVEGDRVYGPGVNDIKGGTAMMRLVLRAIDRFAPEAAAGARWVVALNASEETDSAQFVDLAVDRLTRQGRPAAVLVFESADPVDETTTTVVQRRKGRLNAQITCHGRSAHSGADHGSGVNALVELARIVAALAARTDPAREVTWNPATARAGVPGVVNRVPHHAVAELEVRAFDPECLAEAREVLLRLAGEGEVRAVTDGAACVREVSIVEGVIPWPGGEGTGRLIQTWRRAARRLGRQVRPTDRGGISDANPLATLGVPILDGLGPAGLNSHCSQRSADGSATPEWMELSSFAPLAAVHTLALAELLATG